jgi:hypothetical protein
LDSCFADSTDLRSIYRALWQSLHPLRAERLNQVTPSLPQLLAALGYHTTLVTDDPEVGSYFAAAEYDECLQLDGTASGRADDVAQTCLARLFAAKCETLRPADDGERREQSSPRLVWVHSRGMFGPWDAPLDLQESLLDREEGDPAPYEGIEPPAFVTATVDDADAVYAASCAYAAQSMVLDDCIDGVRRCLEEVKGDESWLTVLVGARGFALGEHGRVGNDGQLDAELLHVPMLWHFPERTGALARDNNLASHLDVLPTLLDWVGGTPMPAKVWDGSSLLPLLRHSRTPSRDAIVAANTSGQLAIRTADWCLRRGATSNEPDNGMLADAAGELFVRPDDRCEANDVAGLCRDVVERLSVALDEASRQLVDGESTTHEA